MTQEIIQKMREKVEAEILLLQTKLDLLNSIEEEIENYGPATTTPPREKVDLRRMKRSQGRPKGSRNKKDIEAEMRKEDLKAMRKHKKSSSILSDDVNEVEDE